jgi:hypothetical protein
MGWHIAFSANFYNLDLLFTMYSILRTGINVQYRVRSTEYICSIYVLRFRCYHSILCPEEPVHASCSTASIDWKPLSRLVHTSSTFV